MKKAKRRSDELISLRRERGPANLGVLRELRAGHRPPFGSWETIGGHFRLHCFSIAVFAAEKPATAQQFLSGSHRAIGLLPRSPRFSCSIFKWL
jgi:hypothetical protein